MKLRVGAVVLAGTLLGAAALVPAVSEGRNNNAGRDRGRCGQTQCRQAGANCPQDRQRMRDGSCGKADCPQQGPRSDCPGPAGCGPGQGPQGGTGNGAPSTTK